MIIVQRLGRRILPIMIVMAVVALAPSMVGTFRLGVLIEILILGLLAMSLDILIGYTGLPSLGHAAYYGIGGYAVAFAAEPLSQAGPIALALAMVCGGIFAVVTSWLAVRARGIYFLMLTLAFSQILFEFAFGRTELTGGEEGKIGLPTFAVLPGVEASSLTAQRAFYFYTAGVCVVSFLLLRQVVRSPFGRALQGVRDNEARMRSLGYSVVGQRLAASVVAGAGGALAGALAVQYSRSVFPDAFAVSLSVLALLMVIVGGVGTLYGPLVGAAVVLAIRDELSSQFERWEMILGVLFVATVYFAPKGLAGFVGWMSARVRRSNDCTDSPDDVEQERWQSLAALSTLLDEAETSHSEAVEVVLHLDQVGRSFGALRAVDDVSFTVHAGERIALIGPNGAGKTTLCNLIGGGLSTTSGRIWLKGRDVTHVSEHHRARLGVAKTFQHSSLFQGLLVRDNVGMALQRTLGVDRRALRSVAALESLRRAEDATLAAVGLGGRADEPVTSLSHGERRQLELGMALATRPQLLLLDEPTAGMSAAETAAFVNLVASLPPSITIVLIEHDMEVVFRLATRVVVLETGSLLADGTPAVIAEDPGVQRAYLGSAAPVGVVS